MELGKTFDWLERLCRAGLGGMFVYSAWGKIMDPGLFATTVMRYELLPEVAVGLFSLTLPMLEMLAGIMFVFTKWTREAALLATGMLVMFLGALAIAVVRGLEIDCGCFGVSSGGGRTELVLAIVRDLILLVPTAWLTTRRNAWLGTCRRHSAHVAVAILFASFAAQGAVTIDVMFAYDQSAARWLAANGIDGDGLARRAVEKMNAVLPATHLDDYFSFRLAGVKASAAEAAGATDGERLDNTLVAVADSSGKASGAWTDVQAARDAFKADIVVVLIDAGAILDGTSFVDGVSWCLSTKSCPDNLSDFAPLAYSICNVRAVDDSYVVVHEVGHVMGAGHNDRLDLDPGPQLYRYSSAYHFQDGRGVKFHTIMGYADMTIADTDYMLYPAFSSAEFTTTGGNPLGDATHDNTRTLRETCGIVSRFRISGNEGMDLPGTFEKQVVVPCKVIDSAGGTVGLAQITVAKTDKKGESKVAAAFYDLDGRKKVARAVKATVSRVDGVAGVKNVALVVKGEVAPLVVTVAVNGFAAGTFGSYSAERSESVAVLSSSARFRIVGMPAAIDGMAVMNDVECDGRAYHLLPDGEGVGFSAVGTKWGFAKAAGVKYAKSKATGRKELLVDVGKDGAKTNLCGLKLSVNAKTGVFKGSFAVYAEAGTPEMPKLKKFTFKVSGVVADGVGVGRASCKGVTVNVLL